MFTFLLLVVFLSNVCAKTGLRGLSLIDPEIEWKEFSNFVQRFKKNYDTMDEFHSRFEVFRQNIRMIVAHNLDSTQNFTMGVNQFADITPDEFKAMVSRFSVKGPLTGYGCKPFTSSATGVPSSVDWRTKGAVTSVKDQGQCGSCWTFSATGAIEGAWALAKGQLINFSEQELVDCATGVSYGSHGCNGGQMDGAFKFVIENGQCTDTAYPYTSGVTKTGGTCQKCTATAHITSCSDVKPNDQVSLKGAVSKQPVAIALSADTKVFQFYKSGVLTSTDCYTQLNHGVLASGYGEENGLKYWLVKNSWGTSWGDNGYIKILRSDSTNDPGICGIAMMPSFPTV